MYSKATPYKDLLEDYNVPATKFEEWQVAINNFEAHINDPSYQRSASKEHLKQIRERFAQIEALQKELKICIELSESESLISKYKSIKLV